MTKSPDTPASTPVGKYRSVQRVGTGLSSISVPGHKMGLHPGTFKEIKEIICDSRFNLLLVCIPISWIFNSATPNSYALIFIFSSLAIMPLDKLLAFATQRLSMYVGGTLAGILQATLGNRAELIIAILALLKCELRVVQLFLIGSILSRLFLILGTGFAIGGTLFKEKGFDISATRVKSSLLNLSVIGVLLPAALDAVAGKDKIPIFGANGEQHDTLRLSHGAAVVLLLIYPIYLVFQPHPHKGVYDDGDSEGKQLTVAHQLRKRTWTAAIMEPHSQLREADTSILKDKSEHARVDLETGAASPLGALEKQNKNEAEEPKLSVTSTIGLLVTVTVLIVVTAGWLVGSIDGLTATGTINKEFVALILLPVVVNATEYFTVAIVSKDRIHVLLDSVVGSGIQTSLFVIPFMVVLGWIIGHPLTLLFDPFPSVALFVAVLTVNRIVQNGEANWLEGILLICLYIIIAFLVWLYPGTGPTSDSATCQDSHFAGNSWACCNPRVL